MQINEKVLKNVKNALLTIFKIEKNDSWVPKSLKGYFFKNS